MRGYLGGNIVNDLGLTTLPTKSGVPSVTKVVTERRRVSSIKCTYSLSDWTIATNSGPILVCVAHSDYTQSEIEAWVERSGDWSQSDLVEAEVRDRKIRRIGIFPIPETDFSGVTLNEGRPIRTKLNWILNTGQGLQFFCYNLGTANVVASPNFNAQGKANLWPA